MALIGRRIVLSVAFFLTIGACDDPTSLNGVPDAVVEEGVRFQAAAVEGDDPYEVAVQLEVLNARIAPRELRWGGCGITIRLYRSDSLTYDSRIAGGACTDIGHSAVAHAGQVQVLTESIVVDRSQVGSGHYDVVVVFEGRIDDGFVELRVRAGSVDL